MSFTLSQRASQLFSGKRVLALDYGEKRTGTSFMAVGQDPFPLLGPCLLGKSSRKGTKSTSGTGPDFPWEELQQLIEEESIEIVVIGVPHLLDGQQTPMSQKALQFALQVKKRLRPLRCYQMDETLSTYEAQQRMMQSPRFNFSVVPRLLDSVAASIILEDFLSLPDFSGHLL